MSKAVADFNLLNDLKAFMRLFEKTYMISKPTVLDEGTCMAHAQFLINRIAYGSDLPPEGMPHARLTKQEN